MTDKQFKYLKKFISAILFLHLSIVLMGVSLFGLYYKGKVNDCKRLADKLELAEWAREQVSKYESEQKLKSMQESYESQGIKAEEY